MQEESETMSPTPPSPRCRSVVRAASLAAVLTQIAGTAAAGVVSWSNPAGGFWDVGTNWDTGVAPASPADDVLLGLAVPYTATIRSSLNIRSLEIGNADAVLAIENARFLDVGSDLDASALLVNDGVILVNSQPGLSPSTLGVGTATVPGLLLTGAGQAGEVVLNISNGNGDLNDATLDLRSGGTHGAGHTVRGKGRVIGAFTNEGLILADRAGQELRVQATVDQTATGVFRASGDAVLGLADNASVSGGLLSTDTNGRIRVTNGTATLLGGATVEGDAGVENARVLEIGAGGVTNNAVISVNSNQGLFNTFVSVVTDATIAGAGSIDLNVSDANGDLNDATLTAAPGFTGTIGADQSVTGKGRVTGSWINNGAIHADRAGQELRVSASVLQGPGAVLGATDGAVLGLADNALIEGGLAVTDTGGRVSVTNGTATVLAGFRNTGDLSINSARTLAIGSGGMVNDGTITVNTEPGINNTFLSFDADTAISGSGVIDLNVSDANGDFNDAQIVTALGVTATLGAGQTVTGKGRLTGDFVLDGTIEADRPNQDLRIAGTLDGAGGGVVRATNGAFAVFDTCEVTDATLESDTGGAVLARTNNNTFTRVVSNADAGLRNSADLALFDEFTNNGTFTVNTEQGVSTTTLFISGGPVLLRGSGTLRLNVGDANADLNDAQIVCEAGSSAVNAGTHTIAGKGLLDGDWINNGTISADRAGQDLQITGPVDQTGGGVIRADNAGRLLLRNAQVLGGTLDSSPDASVEIIFDNSSLDAVTNLGAFGLLSGANAEILAGGLTNNGAITINSSAGVGSTSLLAAAPVTIDGTGTIALGVSETNADFTDATLGNLDAQSLTLGAGQTVTGKGRLIGDIRVEGTIAPGNNPGGGAVETIRIRQSGTSQAFALAASSEYSVDADAEESNDTLDSTVPVTLEGGTLRFTPVDGFDPPRPTRYTIIEAPSITGTFGTLIYEGTLPEGAVFRVVYEDQEVIAAVTCKADVAAPIGVLDLADITLFTSLFLAQSPLVDLAPPFGVLDLSDINTFVVEFLAGCGG